MTTNDILTWIKTSYLPLTFSQPDATLLQGINDVIRFWNTHSAYRMLKMYPAVSSPQGSFSVDPHFKSVVLVYPSAISIEIALAEPTWTLLGIQVMNYLSADLITINEGYKGYQAYLGSDFQFHFEPSQDPTVGGKLYIQNVPTLASNVAVIGSWRVLPGDDITSEYILDHLLRGSKYYLLMSEGNVLRKSRLINLKEDGSEMVQENEARWKEWKEEIFKDARWFALAQRI